MTRPRWIQRTIRRPPLVASRQTLLLDVGLLRPRGAPPRTAGNARREDSTPVYRHPCVRPGPRGRVARFHPFRPRSVVARIEGDSLVSRNAAIPAPPTKQRRASLWDTATPARERAAMGTVGDERPPARQFRSSRRSSSAGARPALVPLRSLQAFSMCRRPSACLRKLRRTDGGSPWRRRRRPRASIRRA
jgi:hypothetical protein